MIMPKLIIPNLVSTEIVNDIPPADYYKLIFYCYRYMWLLEAGDIIILPADPGKAFLEYICEIKGFKRDDFHIIILDKPQCLVGEVLRNQDLLKQLKQLINKAPKADWSLRPYYFNDDILWLAHELKIKDKLIENVKSPVDTIKLWNSKSEFREIAQKCGAPLAEGVLCKKKDDLIKAIKELTGTTGHLIIKQIYSGGCYGNIGITINEDFKSMPGANKVFHLKEVNNVEEIKEITENLWSILVNELNSHLVAEVYYPNSLSITTEMWIPPKREGKPQLLNYCEQRMEPQWVGLEMPPHQLKTDSEFFTYSPKIGEYLQDRGYTGYISCDAIKTETDKIVFNEINVRLSAVTHIHKLLSSLLGQNYYKEHTFLTRNDIKKISSFQELKNQLEQHNLSYSSSTQTGVIILFVDEQYKNNTEYLIVAPTRELAYQIESELQEAVVIEKHGQNSNLIWKNKSQTKKIPQSVFSQKKLI